MNQELQNRIIASGQPGGRCCICSSGRMQQALGGRSWHSPWHDAMAAILKVWRHIRNPTPSMDLIYLTNNPAKFQPDPIWRDAAFWNSVAPTRKRLRCRERKGTRTRTLYSSSSSSETRKRWRKRRGRDVIYRKTYIKRRVPNNRRVSNKRRVSFKRLVSNKRPVFLDIHICHLLVTVPSIHQLGLRHSADT